MRKSILDLNADSGGDLSQNKNKDHGIDQDEWLDLDQLATVEVTSEDALFPIEHALGAPDTAGWRASSKGPQFIRIHFDRPADIRRILLRFSEPGADRSQEFSVHARASGKEMREVVRQQFTFSSGGATEEKEDYTVALHAVTTLEIHIDPDRAHDPAHSTCYASLKSLHLA